jgi:hypothetical protein
MLRLIAPFSTRGYRVDLAATDRAARRLVLRALTAEGGQPEEGARECLYLEVPETGARRLFRRVEQPGGLVAELCIEDATDLDAALETVLGADAPGLFRALDDGHSLAMTYCSTTPQSAWRLVRATSQVAGRTVWIDATRGDPEKGRVEYAIGPASGGERPLPVDLVAVLGRGWGSMAWRESAWRGRLQVSRRLSRRRTQLEQAGVTLVGHLLAVFAAAPDAFHPRYRLARWAVVWRRLFPTLVFALLVAVLVAPMLLVSGFEAPGWFIALSHPFMLLGVVLAIYFDVRLFDVPPLPRALALESW